MTLGHVFCVKKLSEDNYWKSYCDENEVALMVLNKSANEIKRLNSEAYFMDHLKYDRVEEFNPYRRNLQGLKPVVVDNE